MSRFTSPRERWLWFWTAAIVLANFTTLGLARQLAGAVPDVALGVAFVVGMLLVGVTITTQGWRTRVRPTELTVGLAVLTAAWMAAVRVLTPAERTHLIEYGVIAVLIHEALVERGRQGRPVPAAPFVAIVATSLLGIADEMVQGFIPGRVRDSRDVLFNVLAAIGAVGTSLLLGWIRGRSGRAQP